MILELGLLTLALNFSGYGLYRNWLLHKYQKKMALGEFEEGLSILLKYQRMPWPKNALSSKFVDVAILQVATVLQDDSTADQAWERLQDNLNDISRYIGNIYAIRANSLISRGCYQAALECLDGAPESIQSGRGRQEHSFSYATVYTRLGEFQRALNSLNQIEPSDLTDPTNHLFNWLFLARIHFGSGQIEEARQCLNRISSGFQGEQTSDAAVNYGLALWFARCGLLDQAESKLDEADRARVPRLTKLRVAAKAEIAAANGDIEEALSYFRDLRALEVRCALSYLRAARLAAGSGDPELEESFLRFAIDIDPESHWAKVAGKRLSRHRS
jgi:tetratricopeptide (TPR) repeat protein